MSIALSIENVSKEYRLGEIGYGTLREDIESWWARIRGKEDPNLQVGKACNKNSRTILAIDSISLQHRFGEVTGIVGSNGAGKSTLLKLISGLTSPTSGVIRIKGKIGSLLEVGTGFHPELTGRENVFLNGAILGMTKADIRKRFDEIVAFSGVERFIDTPVKRYSSGMFVRLGFAVAAHMEPEVMLIDEVLAVGDAQFQKKCRDKIRNLAKNGQTVLFVSHSMTSIREICHRGVVINDGKVYWEGDADGATRVHLQLQMSSVPKRKSLVFHGPLSSRIEYTSVEINGKNCDNQPLIKPHSGIRISLYGMCIAPVSAYRSSIGIMRDGVRVLTLSDTDIASPMDPGNFKSEVEIPPLLLRPGQYSICLEGQDDTGFQWISGPEIEGFTIMEEWSDEYPSYAKGLVNIPLVGRRSQADSCKK